jgi:uncharacterized surface anchored protein
MDEVTPKAYEMRLRRQAAKMGFTVRKDKARYYSVDHQNGFMILDSENAVVAGENYALELEDVEDFLLAK